MSCSVFDTSKGTKKKRVWCSHCNIPGNVHKYKGDSLIDSETDRTNKSPQNEFTRNIISKSEAYSHELAGGDYGKSLDKSRSEHKLKSKFCGHKSRSEHQAGNVIEKTIYEYKNENYCESESESDGLMNCQSYPKIRESNTVTGSDKTFPRPVICPALDCGKVIAMDSVMLHFYFDHSKVPRVTFNMKSPEQIVIKPSLISDNASCLAVFLPQDKQYRTTKSNNKDHNTLLLIAARVQSKPYYSFAKWKPNLQRTLFLSVATQTDSFTPRIPQRHLSYASLKDCASTSTEDNTIFTCSQFDKDESLLIWLCKLDFRSLHYSVTLLRGDKSEAHCYIGETINIREKRDSAAMMERADCLILQGAAANRLIDDSGNIIAIINVMNSV